MNLMKYEKLGLVTKHHIIKNEYMCLSYPNFVQGSLFVGMRPPFEHFKMFNTYCRGIRKVLGRFGKKTTKNTKAGGELIKHRGCTQETSSRTISKMG